MYLKLSYFILVPSQFNASHLDARLNFPLRRLFLVNIFIFFLARYLIDCMGLCSHHSCECKAGLFSSTLNKCKLLDKNIEQLENGNTDELIYFERSLLIIGMCK